MNSEEQKEKQNSDKQNLERFPAKLPDKTILNKVLPKPAALFSEAQYERVKDFLENKFSLNLEGYRDEYLLRRVSYHYKKSQIKKFDQYLGALYNDEKLINGLLDIITVNVSYFFRDPESFELLKTKIFPELFNKFLYPRVWSVGCSIGAEIYSMAFILHSLGFLERSDLVASDNDAGALQKAKAGIYSSKLLKDVPKEFKKYFSTKAGSSVSPNHSINELFKKSVTFHKHDITSLEMIRRKGIKRAYHLLACRNVMIYFDQPIKEKLYKAFYDWLEPGGILFIGANEQLVGPAAKDFEIINSQFYRKPKKY